MSLLMSSPRRRRRLFGVAFVLGCAGVIALVILLLPKHGSPSGRTQAPPTVPTLGAPTPPAIERAQTAAEATVRPLVDGFMRDLVDRRNLSHAHALLSPSLRTRYSLKDWQAGRNLPIPFEKGEEYSSASSVLAFSGPTTVGYVASLTPSNAAASERESVLLAIRFAKIDKRWLIDYLHHGRTTRNISQANYAPAGFLPWSHQETFWTWSVLVLMGIALIGTVALLDLLLSRGPKSRTA